jgi:hypothetical protein
MCVRERAIEVVRERKKEKENIYKVIGQDSFHILKSKFEL